MLPAVQWHRVGRHKGGTPACWAVSSARAPCLPWQMPVSRGGPCPARPTGARGLASPHRPGSTGQRLGNGAGPLGWPGIPPSPRPPSPALTCGRPGPRSGRTGCAGCSAWRETGGWRHRWWLPGGTRPPPLGERGAFSAGPLPGRLAHPTRGTWGYGLRFSKDRNEAGATGCPGRAQTRGSSPDPFPGRLRRAPEPAAPALPGLASAAWQGPPTPEPHSWVSLSWQAAPTDSSEATALSLPSQRPDLSPKPPAWGQGVGGSSPGT